MMYKNIFFIWMWMWKNILYGLTLTGFWLWVVTSGSCLDKDVLQVNKYLRNPSFTQIESSSIFSCAAACIGYAICRSFNFENMTKTCFLNIANGTGTEDSLEDAPGFLYSDISAWPKSVAGACRQRDCKKDEKCVVRRNGAKTCVALSVKTEFKLYEEESEKKSWDRARQFCSERHFRLAVVDTMEKDERMREITPKQSGEKMWLGGRYQTEEVKFMWINNKTLLPGLEVKNRPRDTNEKYCLKQKYKNWKYHECDHPHYFVCEVIVGI